MFMTAPTGFCCFGVESRARGCLNSLREFTETVLFMKT